MNRRSAALAQIGTHDVRRRAVDHVPVVDVAGVGEVQIVDASFVAVVSELELSHQNDQREQSVLVEIRVEKRDEFRSRHTLILTAKLAQHRHRNSAKSITLTVLARTCFEKTQMNSSICRISCSLTLSAQLRCALLHL